MRTEAQVLEQIGQVKHELTTVTNTMNALKISITALLVSLVISTVSCIRPICYSTPRYPDN